MEADKNSMDRVLDLEDLESAMRQLKSNKALGTDGFPVEFYRTFWDKIKVTFYYVIQEALNCNILHQSAHRGIMSLLEKNRSMGT